MPLQLLPKSAAAFLPRVGPTIVLDAVVQPWFRTALRRSNKSKRALNNVAQHVKYLEELLASATATWTLASVMLPTAGDADCFDASPAYQMLHINAYVVHVDMVSEREVCFKPTKETIESLVDYHKHVHMRLIAKGTFDWPGKEEQLQAQHATLVHAINSYVFRTDAHVLEGLEDDGSGEMLAKEALQVKQAILGLFQPVTTLAALSPSYDAMTSTSSAYDLTSEHASWATAQDVDTSMLSQSPEQWPAMPCTPYMAPVKPVVGDTPSSGWQISGGQTSPGHPSPTPSLTRSVYSQADSNLYSSPLASFPVPRSAYDKPFMGADEDMESASYDAGLDYVFCAPQYTQTT